MLDHLLHGEVLINNNGIRCSHGANGQHPMGLVIGLNGDVGGAWCRQHRVPPQRVLQEDHPEGLGDLRHAVIDDPEMQLGFVDFTREKHYCFRLEVHKIHTSSGHTGRGVATDNHISNGDLMFIGTNELVIVGASAGDGEVDDTGRFRYGQVRLRYTDWRIITEYEDVYTAAVGV